MRMAFVSSALELALQMRAEGARYRTRHGGRLFELFRVSEVHCYFRKTNKSWEICSANRRSKRFGGKGYWVSPWLLYPHNPVTHLIPHLITLRTSDELRQMLALDPPDTTGPSQLSLQVF